MAAIAVRVFGNPITQGTRTQRAQQAKNYQNADGKLDQALQASIQSQKAAVGRTGPAPVSSTYGRVYNATGAPITYVTAHSWEGKVVGKYPVVIQNGQWAVFEHVGTPDSNCHGSVAAVVYNIQDCCDAMIAWDNPFKIVVPFRQNNKAYCEMNDPGYFNGHHWNEIHTKLMASGTESRASMDGYTTQVSIAKGSNTPWYMATFSLDV